jgi:hypothetical protein
LVGRRLRSPPGRLLGAERSPRPTCQTKSLKHAGGWYYWLDPVRGVAGVILMQFLPFADSTALGVYDTFERGVYQLIGQ